MKIIERFADGRNTVEGKAVACLLSFVLAFSFMGMPGFALQAAADELAPAQLEDGSRAQQTFQPEGGALLTAEEGEGAEATDEPAEAGEYEVDFILHRPFVPNDDYSDPAYLDQMVDQAGSVTGLPAPSAELANRNLLGYDGLKIAYPESYPNITVNKDELISNDPVEGEIRGRTFVYAEADSPEATQPGYYTVQWTELKAVEWGIGTYRYTMTGQVFLNYDGARNVAFFLTQPGAVSDAGTMAYEMLEGFPLLVETGQAGGAIAEPPISPTIDKDGCIYKFTGWYLDAARTQEANLNDAIPAGDFTTYGYYGGYERDFSIEVKNYEGTYDGQYHGPEITVTDGQGGNVDDVKLYYAETTDPDALTDDQWQAEYPQILDAGTQNWCVRAVAQDGTAVTKQFTLKLEKRGVTINAQPVQMTYGDETPDYGTAQLVVDDYDKLDASAQAAIDEKLKDIDRSQQRMGGFDTNAGTYPGEITTVQSKESYESAYSNFTFTIVPADFTVNAASFDGVTITAPVAQAYTGQEQKLEPVLQRGELPLRKDVDYEIVGYEGDTTAAGDVIVSLKGKNNYEGAEAVATYTIGKRAATVTIPNHTMAYGSTDPLPAPTVQVDGTGLTDEQLAALNEQLAFIAETPAVFENEDSLPGDHNLVLSAAVQEQINANNNFSIIVEPGICTVTAAADEGARIDMQDQKQLYNGQALQPQAKVVRDTSDGVEELEGYTVFFQVQQNGEWVDCTETPGITEVGELQVRAWAQKSGYAPVQMDEGLYRTLTIEKRPVIISAAQPAEKSTKMYGTDDPEFDAATLAIDGSDQLSDETREQLLSQVKGILAIPIPVQRVNVTGGTEPEEDATTTEYSNNLQPVCDADELNEMPELANFSFSTQGASFTITKVSIEDADLVKVSGLQNSVYDGQEHTCTPTLAYNGATLQERTDYTLQSAPSDATNAGDKEYVLIGDGNFTGRLTVGYRIDPRDVAVQLPNVTLSFGQSFTDMINPTDFTIQAADNEELPAGLEELVRNALSRVTVSVAPGEYNAPDTYEGAIVLDDNALASLRSDTNFNFTVTAGNLEVTQASFENASIQMEGATAIYSGRPLQAQAQVVEYGTMPLDGFTYTYEYTDEFNEDGTPQSGTWQDWTAEGAPSQTDAGKIAVRAQAERTGFAPVKMADDAYVVLEVTPCPVDIMITAGPQTTKLYGEPDPDFGDAMMMRPDVTEEAWASIQGIDLAITYNTADQSAGEKQLGLSKSATELNGQFPNFTFNIASATFTIEARNVAACTVVAPENAVFTGEVLKLVPSLSYEITRQAEEETVSETITLDPQTDFTITYSNDAIDAGLVVYTVQGAGNYTGTIEGQYEIAPLAATIEVPSAEKQYGADEPDLGTAAITVGGKPLSECPEALQAAIADLNIDLKVVRNGSETAVGTYEDVLTIAESADDLNSRQGNFVFEVQPGDYHVKALSESGVSLTMEGASRMYDGQELKVEAQLQTDSSAGNGWSVEYSWAYATEGQDALADDQWSDWASDAPALSGAGMIFARARAVCDGYEPVPMNMGQENGDYVVLEVTKRPVSLTIADAGKTYGEDDPSFADATIEFGGEPTQADLQAVLQGAYPDIARVQRVDAYNVEDAGTYQGALRLSRSQDELNGVVESGPVAASSDFDFTVNEGTFTIAPKNLGDDEVTLPVLNDIVFDAVPFSERSLPEVFASYNVQTAAGWNSKQLQENVDYTAAWEGTDGVGTIKLTVTAVPDGNYTGSKSVSCQVTPCQVRLSAGAQGQITSKAFGAANPKFNPAAMEIASSYGDGDPIVDEETKARVLGNLQGLQPDLTVVCSGVDETTVPGIYEDAMTLAKTAEELHKACPNYEFEIVPADFTVVEAQADLTVNLQGGRKVYDGAALKAEAQLAWDGAEVPGFKVEYRTSQQDGVWDENWTEQAPELTDAGTLYVQARASLDGYTVVNAADRAELTVEPRPVVIDATQPEGEGASWCYFGDKIPAFADAAMDIEGLDALSDERQAAVNDALKDVDLTVSCDRPINAVGTYWLYPAMTAEAYGDAFPNFTFQVTEGSFEVRTAPAQEAQIQLDDASRVYNGTDLVPAAQLKSNGGDFADAGRYTLQYAWAPLSGNTPGQWSAYSDDAASAALNVVGRIAVKAKAVRAGYTDITMADDAFAVLEVTKRPATLAAAPASMTYGDAFAGAEDAVLSLGGNDLTTEQRDALLAQLNGADRSVALTGDAAAEWAAAGTYAGALVPAATAEQLNAAFGNFDFAVTGADFTIRKADLGKAQMSGLTDAVYTGLEQTPAPAIAFNGRDVAAADYTLGWTGNKNAGTAKVTATAADNGNFTGSIEGTFSIEKRDVAIDARQPDHLATKSFDKSDPDFNPASLSISDYDQLGSEAQAALSAELAIDLAVVRSDANDNSLGTHERVLGLSQTQEALNAAFTNFNISVELGNFTITEASTEATLTLGADVKVYDGAAAASWATLSGAEAGQGGYRIQYATAAVDEQGNVGSFGSFAEGAPTLTGVGAVAVKAQAVRDGYETIAATTADGKDYALMQVTPRKATIDAAQTGDKGGKVYGAADPAFDNAVRTIDGLSGLPVDRQNQLTQELGAVSLSVVRTGAGIDENVGSYGSLTLTDEAQAAIEGLTNFDIQLRRGSFEIRPAGLEANLGIVQAGAPDDVVYNGEAQDMRPAYVKHGERDLVEGSDYTLAWSDSTKAGTAKVTLTGTGNYTGSRTLTYTVAERPVTIQPGFQPGQTLYQKTYGYEDPERVTSNIELQNVDGTAELTTAQKTALRAELRGIDLTGTRSDAGTEAGEAVGLHQGVVGIAATAEQLNRQYPDFTFTVNKGDLRINPANLAVAGDVNFFRITAPDDVVYNGQTVEALPTVERFGAGATVLQAGLDFAVSYEGDAVNAGEVTVRATGQGNYTGSVTATFRILPLDVTVSANDFTKYYGDADPSALTAVVTVDGRPGAAKPNDGQDIAYTIARAEGEDAGEYAITVSGETDQGNYRVSFSGGTFTIVPLDTNVVRVEKLSDSDTLMKTYDGAASTLAVETAVEGSVVEYSLDGERWTDQAPSFRDAGTYTVWVRASAPNYETTPAVSTTFSIDPRPVTITVNPATKVSGAANPQFTGTIEGLVNDGDLGNVTFGRLWNSEVSGVYVGGISATYTPNPNYTVRVVNGTLTITAAPVTPTPTPTPSPEPSPEPTPTPTPAPAPTPAPTPGDGDGGAATGDGGAEVPAAPAVPDAADLGGDAAADGADAGDEAATDVIEDDAVPQAAGPGSLDKGVDQGGVMQLLQAWWPWLLLAAAVVIAGGSLFFFLVAKRRDDEEEVEEL